MASSRLGKLDADRYAQSVEWEDVQSLVRRPYAHWTHSAHLILSIHDTAKARAWLRRLWPKVRVAGEVYGIKEPQRDTPKGNRHLHFNIAFTASGFRKLGMAEEDLNTFERAFVEGMAPEPKQPDNLDQLPWHECKIRTQGTTRRAGLLGDLQENHASNWQWGGIETGPDGEPVDARTRVLQGQVDILLMVFASQARFVERYVDHLLAQDNGIVDPIRAALGTRPSNHVTTLSKHEHFGFKDGISQPLFPDTRKARNVSERWLESHQVAAGEFVLGYLNERDERAEVPSVARGFAPEHVLPQARRTESLHPTDRKAFGHNGTYLVARQLDQDLAAFDALVEQAARLIQHDYTGLGLPTPEDTALPRQKAAELLIGRAVDGTPLSDDVGKAYERIVQPLDPSDAPEHDTERNDFLYHKADQAGMRCPIGSHVRRTNPRDSLEPDPQVSLNLSKQHRILRRGRIYGDPVPTDGFTRHQTDRVDDTERGLFFICLNTDIAGQFEFIQDTWVNNPNFGDLEGERDPILSVSMDTRVSLPSKPFTRWFERGRPVVTVRGGAYFFLPGRNALRALALKDDMTNPMTALPDIMFDGRPARTLRANLNRKG